MKILEGVVKHHSVGSHCTTTILKTLSKHAGYSFSEDMCLGLSSGLGFTYQKYIGLNYYFFTGRNEQRFSQVPTMTLMMLGKPLNNGLIKVFQLF